MRISDWSSDVCSSDLRREKFLQQLAVTRLCTRRQPQRGLGFDLAEHRYGDFARLHRLQFEYDRELALERAGDHIGVEQVFHQRGPGPSSGNASRQAWNSSTSRSEEHTSELQSLMRSSYAVFCLKKK